MNDQVTLLRPGVAGPGARGLSASLPFDRLEQVRGRVLARELSHSLGSIREMPHWTPDRAREWWASHGAGADA